MVLIGIAAASAAGAVIGGAIFGGHQAHQNRKAMDTVYKAMAASHAFNESCDRVVSAVTNDTPTVEAVEAKVVEESEDSADDHCSYAVGDVVYVPDGVISESGFAVRSGNYRIKSIDDEDILVIQKSKKTRTFRVRANEVEKRG